MLSSVRGPSGGCRLNPASRGEVCSIAGLFLVAVFVLLIVSCGGSNHALPTATTIPTATVTPVVLPPTTPSHPAVSLTAVRTAALDPRLPGAIDQLLAGQHGVYGVLLMRPDGAIEYQRNADTPFIAASLYKLILITDIYAKRERGEISFDQQVELLPDYFPAPGDFPDGFYDQTTVGSTPTVRELVFAAGSYSSNVAAKALLSITDSASLNQTTGDLGLDQTYLFIDPTTSTNWVSATTIASSPDVREAVAFIDQLASDGPVNITTPRDMCRYFQLLLAGQIVNADVSAEILDLLKQQAVDDRFPYLLPPNTDVAHKTGNLDHVVHDVGVIWAPAGPVILAAMIEDPLDDDHATQIIQRLALIAYGNFDVPPFTEHAVPEVSPAAGSSVDQQTPTVSAGNV